MYHTTSHQYVWVMVCCLQLEVQKTSWDQRRLLPSMASMVMIKSGSMWETCHLHVPWWTHCCCQMEACWWLMAILNGSGGLLCKVNIPFPGFELMRLLSGLAKLFPITTTVKETGKSPKEADERYGEYEGTGIQWIEDWVRVLGEVGWL